ncbi:MAG: MopE-related protein [Myxococcota bacterium]
MLFLLFVIGCGAESVERRDVFFDGHPSRAKTFSNMGPDSSDSGIHAQVSSLPFYRPSSLSSTPGYLTTDKTILLDGGNATGDASSLTSGSAYLEVDFTPEDATEEVIGLLSTSGYVLDYGARTLLRSSTTIGTFASLEDGRGQKLKVTFNSSATVADTQALLRALTYNHSGTSSFTTKDRTLTVTLDDGSGSMSSSSSTSITIAVTDTPTIYLASTAATFTEGDAATTLDGALELVAPSAAAFDDATLVLSPCTSGEDTLDATSVASGITKTYTVGTCTLKLEKTSSAISLSDLQSTLRSVNYANTSDAPSGTTHTIAFTATSDAGTGATVNYTLTIAAVNDAPSVTLGPVLFSEYLEGDGAKALVNTSSVTDVDDTQIDSAIIKFDAGFVTGQDVLDVTGLAIGILSTWDASKGILTLTGSSSKSNYATALRNVRFTNTNTDNPTEGSRTISWTVNDGDTDSVAVTRSFTVKRVNDAPTVNLVTTSLTYSEGAAASTLASGVLLTDPESDSITEATITIAASGADRDEDVLDATTPYDSDPSAAIRDTFDKANGVLRITGTGSLTQYRDILRSVTYRNSDTSDPTATRRTLSWVVKDNGTPVGTSTSAAYDINVSKVNDAPSVTLGAVLFSEYLEGAGVKTLVGTSSITDVDDTRLNRATIQFDSGFVTGQDVLNVTSLPVGILSAWDASRGILTLTGSDTKANFATALRNVTYKNENTSNPTEGTRTISWTVNDGDADSTAVKRSFSVKRVNDAPNLTLGTTSLNYAEGDGKAILDSSPSLTITDVDSSNIASATITISSGYVSGEDTLSATETGSIKKSTSTSGGKLTLTLTGTDTLANYVAVLKTVTYENTDSSTPTAGTRTITWAVTDAVDSGDGATSTAQNYTVSVSDRNSAPVLSLGASSLSPEYKEGDKAAQLAPSLTITDADHRELRSARLSFVSGSFQRGEDQLTATPGDTGITVSFNSTTGQLSLSGRSSVANYQTVLRSVTYQNTNTANPSETTRQLSWTVNDGVVDSEAQSYQISVKDVNDAPNLTLYNFNLNYTEDSGAVQANVNPQIVDVDSTQIKSATVQLTSGRVSGEDVLAATVTGSIAQSFDPSSGTLTLTGADTLSNYTTVLRSVTYENTNQNNPNTGARTLTWTITDDRDEANDTTSTKTTVAVRGQNDAPQFKTVGLTYTLTKITEDDQGNAGNTISSILTSDVSSGGVLTNVVTDPDGTTNIGVAVTAASADSNGKWQYSTDCTRWSDVSTLTPPLSDSSALLLENTDCVRWAPDGKNGETTAPSLTFRLWDRTTTQTAGQRVNASTTGGTTAFSAVAITPTIAVESKNDKPTINISQDLKVSGAGYSVTLDPTTSTDVDNTDRFCSLTWKESSGAPVGLPSGGRVCADLLTCGKLSFRTTATTTVELSMTYADNCSSVTPSEDTVTATETVTIVAGKPFADAGADRDVPVGVSIKLDGSGSTDTDGSITSYAWELLKAGEIPENVTTHVNLTNKTTATPTLIFNDSYITTSPNARVTVRLTVTDDAGNTSTDDVTIYACTGYFEDRDGDRYGNASAYLISCSGDVTALPGYDSKIHIPQDFNKVNTDNWRGFDCLDTGTVTDGTTSLAASAITTRVTWYIDQDGDTYGSATERTRTVGGEALAACTLTQPAQSSLRKDDCEDSTTVTTTAGERLTPSELNPQTRWYNDVDGDGYTATNAASSTYLIPDSTGRKMCHCASDCGTLTACVAYTHNDAGAYITESCVPVDNQACKRSCVGGVCGDGATHPGIPSVLQQCDDPGKSGVNTPSIKYFPPSTNYKDSSGNVRVSNWVTSRTSLDCNEASALANASALEQCDPFDVDENCNGYADEKEPNQASLIGANKFFLDSDGDNFGQQNQVSISCGTTPPSANYKAYPRYTIRADSAVTSHEYYEADLDGDTKADCFCPDNTRKGCYDVNNRTCSPTVNDALTKISAASVTCTCPSSRCTEGCQNPAKESCTVSISSTCTQGAPINPDWFSAFNQYDCDDTDLAVYPNAPEVCDGQYNDCSATGYSSTAAPSDEIDHDNDKYVECAYSGGPWANPSLTLNVGSDCAPNDSAIYPGAAEICDGVYNSCDTWTDRYADATGDCFCTANTCSTSGPNDFCVDSNNNVCTPSTSVSSMLVYVDDAGECFCQDSRGSRNCVDITGTSCAPRSTDGSLSVTPYRYVDNDNDCRCDSSTGLGTCVDLNGFTCTADAPLTDMLTRMDCSPTGGRISPRAPTNEQDKDNDCYVGCDANSLTWKGGDLNLQGCSTKTLVTGQDCDDNDNTVYPTATEACDGQYNDCTSPTYSASSAPGIETDNDADGYVECTYSGGNWNGPPISGGSDCDDADTAVYPGAASICDGQYNNCSLNSYASDAAPLAETDNDGDRYVECNLLTSTVWAGDSSVIGGNDCDDVDRFVYPAANEVCDGQYNDCDNSSYAANSAPALELDTDADNFVGCTVDSTTGWQSKTRPYPFYAFIQNTPKTIYVADYGTARCYCDNSSCLHNGSTQNCVTPAGSTCSGYTASSVSSCTALPTTGYLDCDPNDGVVFPGANEICDGQYNDCSDANAYSSGAYDSTKAPLNETDNDADAYVECTYSSTTTWAGPKPFSGGGDCDDADRVVYPAATELCDGQYNDCDSSSYAPTGAPNDETDGDSDGYVTCTSYGATSWVGDGRVVGGSDCDDADRVVYPGADDTLCDGQYNDCSGKDYTEFSAPSDEIDVDGDGWVTCERSIGVTWKPYRTTLPEPNRLFGSSNESTECYCPTRADCTNGMARKPSRCVDQTGTTCEPTACDAVVAGQTRLSAIFSGKIIDCDDADATAFPGAGALDAPLACTQDQDGDFWGNAAAGTGVVVGTDCNDKDNTVHPNRAETCENPGPQKDNDCNGDVNSSATVTELEGWDSTVHGESYRDRDGDSYAGTGELPVKVCDKDAPGYSSRNVDCNDGDSTVNHDAKEACDGIDNNCSGSIDILGSDRCVTMYRDNDGDGYGNVNLPGCVCPTGNARVEDPERAGEFYVISSMDCVDSDENIKPLSCADGIDNDPDKADGIDELDPDCIAGRSEDGTRVEIAQEFFDSNDNDCDGFIPAIELDCDDDGARPQLPGGINAGLATNYVTASDVGLETCTTDSTGFRDVDCWDQPVRMACDKETGLWGLQYRTSDDGYGGRYPTGLRTYQTTPSRTEAGDCDDQCPLRTPGAPEVCDGIDNDCSGVTVVDSDKDGLPDSMDPTRTVSGTINKRELDFDRDGAMECTNPSSGSATIITGPQQHFSVQSCTPAAADVQDCSNLCFLSNKDQEERCDGFLNICGGEDMEGQDRDLDGHQECGYFSTPAGEGLVEDAYVVVFLNNAPTSSTDSRATSRTAAPPSNEDENEDEVEDEVEEDSGGWDTGIRDSGDMGMEDSGLTEEAADAQRGQARSQNIATVKNLPPGAISQAELVPLLRPRVRKSGAVATCDEPLSAQLQMLIDPVQFRELMAANDQRAAELLIRNICSRTDGQCALIRISLNEEADDTLYNEYIGDRNRMTEACEDAEEELLTRTVWRQERILESRKTVVEWECNRLYGVPCAQISSTSQLQVGWERSMASAEQKLAADTVWWLELGRYTPQAISGGTVMECWGDPTDASTPLSDSVGGECDDKRGRANRDRPEGPDDIVSLFLDGGGSCDLCLDGIDNNCDGNIDCADPSCARCFVGTGFGCGGGSEAPCTQAGCASAIRSGPNADRLAPLVLLVFIGFVAFRRRAS